MAEAVGTLIKVRPEDGFKKLVLVAVNATDGIKFSQPAEGMRDEDIVIVAQNTHATTSQTVTLKAPTEGSYAASDTDLTLSLAAGEIAVCRIESARYCNKDGSILVKGSSTDVKVQLAY